MGQGDKAARTCTCKAVLVPPQRIFGFGGHSNPLGRGGNRRGRTRVCHAHVHHHWPPREVQEEVTALRVALGSWRVPCRTGGAAGVGGGRSAGGCRGIVRGGWGHPVRGTTGTSTDVHVLQLHLLRPSCSGVGELRQGFSCSLGSG